MLLSPNIRAYVDYLKRKGLKQNNVLYIYDSDQIKSLNPEDWELVILDGFYRRDNAFEIEDELRFRGFIGN